MRRLLFLFLILPRRRRLLFRRRRLALLHFLLLLLVFLLHLLRLLLMFLFHLLLTRSVILLGGLLVLPFLLLLELFVFLVLFTYGILPGAKCGTSPCVLVKIWNPHLMSLESFESSSDGSINGFRGKSHAVIIVVLAEISGLFESAEGAGALPRRLSNW